MSEGDYGDILFGKGSRVVPAMYKYITRTGTGIEDETGESDLGEQENALKGQTTFGIQRMHILKTGKNEGDEGEGKVPTD